MISRIRNILKSFSSGSRTVKLTDHTFYPIDFIGNSYNERNFREYICEAFGRNPYINMVVPRIADIQSTLPRSFKDLEGNPVDADTVDSGLVSLLNQPNPKTTRTDFYNKIDQFLKVTGNAIIYGVSANPTSSELLSGLGMDKYMELHIANIDDVYINTTNGTETGTPISYQITDSTFNGATYTADAKDVLHLKITNIISSSSNYGLSPLFGQQKAYAGSTATFDARVSSYKNGGATGIISPKGSELVLLPDHKDIMEEEFNNRTGGTHNFGKVVFSGTGVDFQRITLSPEQLRLIESLPIDLRIVCGVYDVDSVLFSDVQGTTFNNMETAQKRILLTAIRGGDKIDEQLNQWLIQDNYGIENLKYCIDKEDETKVAKVKQRNTDTGKQQVTNIVKDFQAKLISEQSATNTLIINYAYSEDEAKMLLGV